MSGEPFSVQRALALYHAGEHNRAESLCLEILAGDPRQAETLHLLGLVYLQRGQPQLAAGLISQAIQQKPEAALFYNTLGNAFRALGKREQALICFLKATSLNADFPEALSNLGSALEESGQAAEAVASHQRAAALRPRCAEIHGNLGNALRSAGRAEEAKEAYEAALRLRPDYAEAWMNLGNIFFDRDEYSQAEEHYRKALKHNPQLAAAQTNLGSALTQRGKFKEAETWCVKALDAAPGDPVAQSNLAAILIATGRAQAAEQLCRQALQSKPGMPEAHMNLGLALARLHRLDEAGHHCRKALEMRPNRPTAYANLARILQVQGRFAESESCLQRALAICPDHLRVLGCYGDLCAAQVDFAGALHWYDKSQQLAPEAGLASPARAMVYLAMGDFERGWEEYEARWRLGDCAPAEFSQPPWDGTPFPGKTVLLHSEQGLGDTIQFIRFARSVKQLGGRVLVACQRPLMPLLSSVEGVDQILPAIGELPDFDYHLPLLSLPRVLGTREHSIPRDVPYVQVPDAAICRARRRLADRCGEPDGRFRVGLVWAGSPDNPDDANRSMRLDQLGHLFTLSRVQFLSLQRGVTIPPGSPLLSVEEESDSIVDTAAILLHLDLVITVDTMIAHLAGALGRPVWTLLKFAPDWRWMTGRDNSPWYPTMRLFRQRRFGDWDDVVRRVGADLSRWTAEPESLTRNSFKVASLDPI